jgi:hypothetical protein
MTAPFRLRDAARCASGSSFDRGRTLIDIVDPIAGC